MARRHYSFVAFGKLLDRRVVRARSVPSPAAITDLMTKPVYILTGPNRHLLVPPGEEPLEIELSWRQELDRGQSAADGRS